MQTISGVFTTTRETCGAKGGHLAHTKLHMQTRKTDVGFYTNNQ